MSATDTLHELTESFLDLYRGYYQDDINELATRYPKEQQSLYITARDLLTHDQLLYDDWLEQPKELRGFAEKALAQYDLAVDLDLSEATVRLTDPDGVIPRVRVSELNSDHVGDYVALTGQLASVTGITIRVAVAAFRCERCGIHTYMPQKRTTFQEPHECQGCERQGPFTIDADESELVDLRKVKLEEPPDERTQGHGQSLTLYVEDDLCHVGGENGLPDRAGERVTVFSTVHLDDSDFEGNTKSPETEAWLQAHAFEFDQDSATDIDVDDYRDDFERHANASDAVERAARSIAPELDLDDDLYTVMEAAVAWLFNSYRIDPENGGSYRGDLHMCLIGDPGLGKSTIMENLDELAPKSEYRSGTGLSAVGLTAAAKQEEFAGTTEWVLEPGVLPRANGGHCIIDEVDAVVDEKTKAIHDALEGEQMVKVDKAGISADLPTRTALLASGNPVDGRFDRYGSIPSQIDLDPALVSRMDLLFALQDVPDEERDRSKGRHILDSYDELSRAEVHERGIAPEPDEPETTDAEVDRETFRAWLKYARENVFPTLTPGAKDRLLEFYVETRDLNDAHSKDNDDAPIATTPRTLEAGIRLSTAFARAELSDRVTVEHAERAIKISRQVVGLNFDPETGQFDAGRVDEGVPSSQKERRQWVLRTVDRLDDGDDVLREDLLDAAEEKGLGRSRIESDVEKLLKQGDLMQPATDSLRRP